MSNESSNVAPTIKVVDSPHTDDIRKAQQPRTNSNGGDTPVLSYANKVNPTSLSIANFRKIVENLPQGAKFDVYLLSQFKK